MTTSCDAVVLGVGGVGSAALMHLACRGLHVIGLDRFPTPHDRGSSHGQTRAIRQAYFEHPDYVPLLRRAYSLWDELEQESQRKLFHRVGLVEAGPVNGTVVPGVLASARDHQLPVQRWTVDECHRQFPALRLSDDSQVVFEENAGFLMVEDCVETHLQQARRHGAEVRVENVQQWELDGRGVRVTTDSHVILANSLVIAAGAWTGSLLHDLGLPLKIVRKHLHWHQTEDPRLELTGGFPVFFLEEADSSFFYGFPKLDHRGVKVAEHSGGTAAPDPLGDSRQPESEDQQRVSQFVQQRLPSLRAEACHHTICFYTMTPDDHFIVDSAPDAPQVVFAGGLSGHGFKFTTVLGEALTDRVLGEPCSCPMEFLSLARFADA